MPSNLIYTITDDGKKQTFEGFKSASRPLTKEDEHKLWMVVAFFEDTFDLWYIDIRCNDLALSELNRYYRSQGYENVVFQEWTTCLAQTNTNERD